MYYKLYRRRNYIYVGLFLAVFICYLYVANSGDTKKQYEQGYREKRSGERVNINNYKIPEPCIGCPGENGKPVYLNVSKFLIISIKYKNKTVILQNKKDEESKGLDKVYEKEFFNLRASDKISLWRSLPDVRHGACKKIEYPHDLPTASVIFVFKNERWSAILRSVYSVINRSPRHLLKEVILVDDVSEIGKSFIIIF